MVDQRRMRVLLLTRNLPPLVGGMERLNWHIADELSSHAEIRVCGPTGSARLAPDGVFIDEVPLRPLWKFLLVLIWTGWKIGRTWQPDVVLAGSGLTALPAYLLAKLLGSHSAVYVHGLDVAIKHPVYRALWLPALRSVDRVIANSGPTSYLASIAGVREARIGVVYPGVQLPDYPQDREAIEQLRKCHDLGSHPVLLSVGRLTNRKGLREFVTDALPLIVAKHPGAVLVIVGEAPADALYAESQSEDSIRRAAESAGVASALRFLGVVRDYRELGLIFGCADIHVFPVRELPGDPEGFGMVAVEAAAHGVPTVAFAAGGVTDAVAEGKSGYLVKNSDYEAFSETVSAAFLNSAKLERSCTEFAKSFAWPVVGQAILKELRLAVGRN